MMIETQDKNRRAVGIWLVFMAFTVFAMVVVGGATRLTESGLSMVNWNPVTGAIPPLSEEAWQAEFNNYKQSPEYIVKNAGMSLDEFKGIFYWEWGHRLLGRLIGVFFFIPFVYFWAKARIPEGYKPRLITLFILGGMQGLLGWYMVKSGLVDEPSVSHYRLTAHLSLALIIFSALLWTALDLLREKHCGVTKSFKTLTHLTMVVLALQLIMGGLVAGLKAGYIMNSWPLMDGQFIPDSLMALEPWWVNFVENAITVQFDHRIGAYVLVVLTIVLAYKASEQAHPVKKAALYLFVATILQGVIGIVMLLLEVPVSWGTLHQAGGVAVLACMINLMHICKKAPHG